MDGHQPSLPQGSNPGAQAAKAPRSWKLGQRAAQAALVFLLCVGGFLSLFPWGRAVTRSALLLPALLSASAPAPLVLTKNECVVIEALLHTPGRIVTKSALAQTSSITI